MENAADIATIIEPVSEALTSAITPAQVVAILAGVIGVGMTFVLMWFGVRKLISIFRKAVTKGKISA
mgnify:CR=1 FL=1